MPQPMPDFVPGTDSSRVVPEPRSDDPSGAAPPSASGPQGIRGFVRNPIATFVAGGALVAAAFVAVPAISAQAEAGSMAQLEALVSEYVAAVGSGDVATATALAPVDGAYADASLLDVVQPETPATFDCAPATLLDDVATVSCTVTVAPYGAAAPMRMRLVRDGAWRIETGLAVASPLQAGVAVPEVIDGETLGDDVAIGAVAVWLYPGAYDVDVRLPEIFDGDGAPLVVDGFGASVQPLGSMSAALQDEVAAAAAEHLVRCSETGAVGCPESAPLGEGERFEATFMGWGYSSSDPRIAADVAVARVGGAPDRWRVRVEVLVAADLESYDLIATASPETGEP